MSHTDRESYIDSFSIPVYFSSFVRDFCNSESDILHVSFKVQLKNIFVNVDETRRFLEFFASTILQTQFKVRTYGFQVAVHQILCTETYIVFFGIKQL